MTEEIQCKKCRRCAKEKPLYDFGRSSRNKDKLCFTCRSCILELQEYYDEATTDPTKIKQCTTCFKFKNIVEFNKSGVSSGKNRRRGKCKECERLKIASRIPSSDGVKKCYSCNCEKSIIDFPIHKGFFDGRHNHCKECSSLNKKLKKYNLSAEQYYNLSIKQNGKCLLCNKSNTELVVDHDHNTGRIRGLLCRSCNGSLGVLGDNVESLQRVIMYLEGKL